MTIARAEVFVLRHALVPRTGPSIAYASEQAYVYLRLEDADGIVGWGETYLVPGVEHAVRSAAQDLIGRDPAVLRGLIRETARRLEHAYAASAVAVALEDLRARQLGVPIAGLYGGRARDRVRVYAASGGYIEDRHPKDTWPAELERVRAEGFNALKLRIGRYPIREEAPLLESIRGAVSDGFVLMADGNAGYTMAGAVEMGRILSRLRFRWFEEPLEQHDGYRQYERLAAALDITLAGGEILMSRGAAVDALTRGAFDLVQPEPVICGGVGEALFVADVAAALGIPTTPHSSGSAIGIAAAVQVLACLPDGLASAAEDGPFLELGVDVNRWREGPLTAPWVRRDGWLDIPTAPGLGVDVDDAFIRRSAVR
jgi:D-galactarolactone cycloisomerase